MHDAMWVEIRRAVTEARNELEQVRADYLFFSIPAPSDLGFLIACSLHVHDELSFYSWISFASQCQVVVLISFVLLRFATSPASGSEQYILPVPTVC
jgi:hypothetical protein